MLYFSWPNTVFREEGKRERRKLGKQRKRKGRRKREKRRLKERLKD